MLKFNYKRYLKYFFVKTFKEAKFMKRIKKLLIGVISLAILITPISSLFGCKNDTTLTFAKAYDLSAIAGIGILSTDVISEETQTLSAQAPTLDQAEKDEIIKNLAIAQSITNNGLTKSEVADSTNPNYKYYYTVTATDYSGANKTYEFYYNQTDVTDKDDKFDNEQEYRLDGIVILDGVEYNMIGEQEVDGKETEFSFKISITAENYVIIEHETERNETEFSYTAYKNGVKYFETEAELEMQINGNVEIEFEIFDRANNVNQKYVYEFYTQAGEQFAKVIIKDGKKVTQFAKVKIIKGANGFKYEFITN